MNEFRMSLLKERADAIRPELAKAREVAEKAESENRDMTAEEKAIYDPVVKSAREIADGMKKVRDEDAMMTEISTEFGGVMGDLGTSPTEAKSRRLSFKGLGTKVATQMVGVDGTKALAPSGATIVGQEFVRDPVALGQVAQSLLDVLPTKQHTSTEYSYLRQTVRTNNAAVVAQGATKPTSIYSVVRVEKSLVVVAQLPEGIPRYWLLDSAALETFVENELTYGLQVAVEAKVLTDVNGTSGIQTTWSILGPIIALIAIAIAFAGCCGRSPSQTGFA